MHARKSSRELPTLENELMKKDVTDLTTHYDPKTLGTSLCSQKMDDKRLNFHCFTFIIWLRTIEMIFNLHMDHMTKNFGSH